jgi:hypothetical protein
LSFDCLKLKKDKPELSHFDRDFFAQMQPKVHTKGGIVGYHRQKKAIQAGAELHNVMISSQQMGVNDGKKHHFGPKRKEKLRRLHRHLDQHDY